MLETYGENVESKKSYTVLKTEINNAEALCFTEHWLNCHKIHTININLFTLANAFCRKNSDHGGSCVFVKNGVMIKGLNSLHELGEEKSFELSAVELNKVCNFCNLHLQES